MRADQVLSEIGSRVHYAAWCICRRSAFVRVEGVGLLQVVCVGGRLERWFSYHEGLCQEGPVVWMLFPMSMHEVVLAPWVRAGDGYRCGYLTGLMFAEIKPKGSLYTVSIWTRDGMSTYGNKEVGLDEGFMHVREIAAEKQILQPWPEIFPWR